ncbi:MAG: aminotransferase [Ignavibacteriota bacterium]|nr:MAG: aminotransferase [Ignavibacteriota bacterium]
MRYDSGNMNLSTRINALHESPTMKLTARAARMKAEGIDVVAMTAGEPDFDTPEHIKAAAIEAIRRGETKYPKPASGLPALKSAICASLLRNQGLTYRPEQVIVTCGAKLAIQKTLTVLINPGDEVLIPTPYWVSYPELVKLAGGTPVLIESDERRDFKLTPEQVRAAITPRTKAFLYCSPSNPASFTYTPDETRALVQVLATAGVAIISDEIYDSLTFGGVKPLSPAAVSAEAYARTITINGASKIFAMTGWRVGFAAGPVHVIEAMIKLQSQGTSGVAPFIQLAYAEGLKDDRGEIERMRRDFERRGRHMYERVRRLPGVTCVEPTGAYYLFPNVSGAFARLKVRDSDEFAERLLNEAHLVVIPGSAFGSDRHIRMSFATSMAQIDAAVDRLEAFLK